MVSISLTRIDQDSPCGTPGGATFTVPAGWTLERLPDACRLAAPAGDDVRIAVCDAPAAPGPDEAVAAAWVHLVDAFSRPLKMRQAMPARDGWDQAFNYGYETSPGERVMVSAIALGRGRAWTVILFHGGEAAFERRRAQVRLVAAGVRPQGYVRESFVGRAPARLDAPRIRRLTDFLESARATAGIPGIALSLVQDGAIAFEGGFGVRRLGSPEPVTAGTNFLIASNTKQFTTLLLAKLVDEGKFGWDTPVLEVLPTFRLGDEEATRRIQVKHLVSASTGLPRKDLEWLLNFRSSSAATVLGLLAGMKPTSRFGEVFQYSNVLGSAAGYLAGHACFPERELGAAFDEAMRTRVLEPLGMRDATFDYARALAADYAAPHSEDVEGEPRAASMDINFAAVPMRPALGLWANARDLARYVRMELARGLLPDGRRYIGEAALLARREPGVAFEEDGAYGMGLVVKKRGGIPVIDHGGALIGFKSNIFWLPEHGVGGALLTNADNGNILVQAFLRKVLEVLFDGREEADEDVATAAKLRREQIAKHRQELCVPADPALVARLAARYECEGLGGIDVRREGSATIFDFGEWRSEVATRPNEDGTISLFTIDPGVATFEFVVGERARRRVLLIRDKQHEYHFGEVPWAP